ncbi:MAG: right-handed parallel beta-helix repeat-containing protein [Methanobacterium sp.]
MLLAVISAGSVMADPVSAATIPVTAGSTNAQIQDLINDAHSGDTISFAPGTYNDIKLTINKTLNLVGNGAVINGINESNTVIFNITSDGNDASGTTVQGFEFNLLNNNVKSGSKVTSTGYAIYLDGVLNVAIRNVTSHNGKSAIYNGASSNILIDNCTFEDVYNKTDAINIMGGNNITIKNSTLNGGRDAVSMASEATNIYVIGNTFLNNQYGAFWGGGISNITVANNSFTGWSGEALGLEKATSSTSIINNTFTDGVGDAIYIQNSASCGPMTTISDIEIIENLFKNIIGAAIGIDKNSGGMYGDFNGSGTGDSIVGINNTIDNVSKGYVNLYSNGTNLNFTMDSSYPAKKANLSVSNGVSSTAIKTGDKTIYTVTVTNRGNGDATNVKVSDILNTGFYSSYASYSSLGSYSNGVWNIGTLGAGDSASLVITATALKSGTTTSQAKVTANDNLTALSSTVQKTINKYINLTYSNSILTNSKVKTGKYVYLGTTVKNSGKDKSGTVKVKITLPKGMKLISVNYPAVYNKTTGTWTFTVPAGKYYTFKVKAQVTSKGTKKVTFNDNGKIQYKYVVGY